MNLDLIIFLGVIAVAYCGYRIGYLIGKDEGQIEGRMSLRREQKQQVGR